MQKKPLIWSALIAGAVSAFALGVVSAPRVGALLGLDSVRRPVVTVSLDLVDQVTALREEKRRLRASLDRSAKRVAALKDDVAKIRQGSEAALAKRDAELKQAGQDIAAMKLREAEFERAQKQNAALSAKLQGLQGARDQARKVSARLAKQETDLQAALLNNAAMAAKMEGLRRARDEAGETSAAHRQTIADLRRDLAAVTERQEKSEQALNAEISKLREALDGKDREIARLRQTAKSAAPRTAPAISASPVPPAAAPPGMPRVPAAPPEGETGALNGARPPLDPGVQAGVEAYRATDYVKAYEIWRPLAARGNPRAQFHVGALYYEGRGVHKDLDQARIWLERAASNGSTPARELLRRIDEERLAKGRATP